MIDNLELIKIIEQNLQLVKNNIKKKLSISNKSAALLIGINYNNDTEGKLNGCINDVNNIKNILINQFDYLEENIKIITDESDIIPTKENILEGMRWLVDMNNKGFDNIWFHYSGHGTNSISLDKYEKDGYDECIVPLDYQENGLIIDNTILDVLIKPLKRNTKCIAIMDCCFSGTIMDLKYKYISRNKNTIINNNSNIDANVILLSGCKDSQTSADALLNDSWNGALTFYLLKVLKESDYNITCFNLLRKVRKKLKYNKFSQIPQITSSNRLKNTSIFIDYD